MGRGVMIPMVSVTLILMISLLQVLFLNMPHPTQAARILRIGADADADADAEEEFRYVVIFDAGSSGTRVHVFKFGHDLELIPFNANQLEFYARTTPGLSSYSSNATKAAESLRSILTQAEAIIPEELLDKTPVRLGATGGLRLLEKEKSDEILEKVRDFLRTQSLLESEDEWVQLLDGGEEGAYMWLTINYALGYMKNLYSETVGVVDLGGASVQMAYAIPADVAARGHQISNGENTYVKELSVNGVTHHLYVHSYLNYGILAARAEILKAVYNPDSDGNPCTLTGYEENYEYGDQVYNARSSPSGSNLTSCYELVVKALKVYEPCPYEGEFCTFGGIWDGGEGYGQKKLFLASTFYYRANDTGIVEPGTPIGDVSIEKFKEEAELACTIPWELVNQYGYKGVRRSDLPYICMDLVYMYTLLVDGFHLHPKQMVTVVEKVPYGDHQVKTAWPLGLAVKHISELSSSPNRVIFVR